METRTNSPPRRRWRAGIAAAGLFLLAIPAAAQTGPTAPVRLPKGPRPGPNAARPQGGPYAHRVLSATSRNGLTWQRDPGFRLDHASVPCALADGNRILLYFVDADRGPGQMESVGCAVSTDSLNFVRQPFVIEGMTARKALDPAVVRGPDGRIRLYYLASSAHGDPASDPADHEIHLATSDDGVRFREAGAVFRYPRLVDPDVFPYLGSWWMCVFGGGDTLIATSPDGLRFTYRAALPVRGWGTVAPVALPDGRLRLYAFDQRTQSGNTVRSFVTSNPHVWAAEAGIRLAAKPGEQITDPYVIPWQGGWKMYFKTERRDPAPGKPSGVRPGPQ